MALGNITDARMRLIISGAMGVLLTLTICYLWVSGQEVPELLKALVTAIWGFFSGHVYTNGTGAVPPSRRDKDEYDK